MIIRVAISTNKVGSGCEDEFELPDDSTPEEIEEAAQEAAFQMIDWDYEVM